MAVANSSNISTIQILRSYANSAPTTLADGQLAFSFVSNTLYIGSNTGIIAISDQATANLARQLANTIIEIQGVDTSQNTSISLLQSGLNSANANISALFGIESSQNTNISLLQFGLNTANANTVYLTGALNSANANIAILFGIEASQNANISLLQTGLNLANANIAILFGIEASQNANTIYLQGALATANANTVYLSGALTTANANTVYLQGGLNTANANTVYITGGLNSANANIALLQGAMASANANVIVLFGVNVSQNANIALLQSGLNTANANTAYLQGALASANANTVYLQSGLNTANANTVYLIGGLNSANANIALLQSAITSSNANVNILFGIELSQNANISLLQAGLNTANANTVYLTGGLNTANANTVYLTGGLNSANANIAILFGIENTQNTWITSNAAYTQSAFDKANTSNNLAQAAFDYANNIIVVGNNITLGTNTTGLLVSNAVTLTTTTSVTNGLAAINQILGKLVPASPATFPSTFGTLTITGAVGPFRMTNFTQTDNTGTGTASVTGGTSVSPLRVGTYTTSTITNINTITGDVISVIKNAVQSGTRTITSGATNAGTYGDLVIINNVDYATVAGIAANFWYSANLRATGTATAGWNNVSIKDTNGVPTSNATWYYDNSAPGTPTFTSPSIVPLAPSLTYSSTVPHYNSATTFRLGVDVSKLSGDMYPASDTFFTGTAGGAFGAPTSNTYTAVGIATPIARNLYVATGSATVNSTSTIIAGFGLSAVGPSVTVDNSYSTASQSLSAALANTVLYKTGTASTMEETSITFGTAVGTGSGLAARIINPGTTDTPTYTASAALFNSQSSTLTANDATIVAATLKHDQTNYSTLYLPVGPNLSTGRTGPQYFTFKFVRTSVSKFDIKYTGTIAGLWVALPGSTIDTTSSINGWMDMSVAYAGSGHPGVNSGGNGSNGCALGGNAVLNTLVTNGSYTCTFGDVSSSSTATNEIYVRIKLTSGQTVSALTLQTASH